MPTSSIVVHSLETPEEYTEQFRLGDEAFSTAPSPASAQFWQEFVTGMPGFRAEQARGAFLDGAQVGGYLHHERVMRLGAARLPTGCIGAVATHPEHRKQGVATAMMHDAIAYARARHYPLLLLDGIPQFYYRYGYTVAYDLTLQEIDRAAILALPSSPFTIRPATPDDAAAVLTLYERQFGDYTGSFERSLELQRYRLQRRSAENPLLLAVDAGDQVHGYLSKVQDSPERAAEIAADGWDAALALLQHHAQLTEAPALIYALPPESPLLYEVIERLDALQEFPPHISPSETWAVRSQIYHRRFAGWMARVVDVQALAEAMLPEWLARWHNALAQWTGTITISCDTERFTLGFTDNEIALRPNPLLTENEVTLTLQALTQLIFGYRPISWFVSQSDQHIPADLLSVLDILFPAGRTYIPGSDWF
jgi:predicted N-acetyltransferase YhbS